MLARVVMSTTKFNNTEHTEELNTTEIEKDIKVANLAEKDVSKDVDKEKKMEVTRKWDVVNKQKPILMWKSTESTKEECVALSLISDWEEHLAVKHDKGHLEFKVVVNDPKRAPFDLYAPLVFIIILDNSDELIPQYLSYVKGTVDCDSEGPPLNIFKERMQQKKILKVVYKNLVQKCVELFQELAGENEDHTKFYETFFKNLKYGDLCIRHMKEFEGKRLFATKEGLKLDVSDVEKKKREALMKKFEGMCKVFKDVSGDKMEKVAVVSDRVVDNPCCLVTGEYGWTANMERIMISQAPKDSSTVGYTTSNNTMKINPENSIMDQLRKKADADMNDKSAIDLVVLVFESSLLTSGFILEEPNTFGNLLKLGFIIDKDASGAEADADVPFVEDAKRCKMEEVD